MKPYIKEEKTKYEIQKVISAGELEQATSEGWRIIESFEVEGAEPFHEDRVQEFPVHIHLSGQDSYGLEQALRNGMGGVVHHLKRFERVKQVVFLVGKTKETAVGELKGQIKQLEEVAVAHEEVVAGMVKGKEEVAKRYAKLEEGVGRMRESQDSYYKQKIEAEKRAREMEADISKIRNAIGERQMNEILKGTS